MEQEEKRGSHAFASFPFHKECVHGVNLHQSEVKPSYSSIIRWGTYSASPARGYALAAATLSSVSLHPLAPLVHQETGKVLTRAST